MKAESATLQKIFYSPSRYIIPVFQRYYTWGKKDWEQLWDDMMELREAGQEKRSHFMGSLVFVPEHLLVGQMPSFQVVDGQQRLTTLSLLLCSLRDFCASRGFEALAAELSENYIIHKFQKGESKLRIFPRHRDRNQYLFVALANETEIPIDGSSNPGKAYRHFLGEIQVLLKNASEQEVREFFDLVCLRLDFVSVTLDAENPYQIFKSLNSTGVDLSESDLIRNFVFMHVSIADQDKFDDDLWRPLEKRFEFNSGKTIGQLDGKAFSGFFRDFLMRDGTYVGQDAAFQSFENVYEANGIDPVSLTMKLTKFVDYYDVIQGKIQHPSLQVRHSLNKLKALEVATTRPLLLNLMDRVAAGSMTNDDLYKAIELLSGFVFRRLVCKEQSRSYGNWFVAVCKELKDDPIENLKKFLKSKGFPSNSRFEDAFVRFSLYRSTGAKSVLAELEQKHPNHIANEAADLSKVEIEHIMPRTLSPVWNAEIGQDAVLIHEEWLHTPGNLTLTGYNQLFGNKPFYEKCNGWVDAQNKKVPGYIDSNIAITNEIALQSTWTAPEIKARAEHLATLAASVYVDGS